MSQSDTAPNEKDMFEQTIGAANPELRFPLRFIFDHAPAPLNTVAYVRSVCVDQDCVVRLLDDLRTHIPPEHLAPSTETNSKQCDVWSFFGVLLMLQSKTFQALEVFDALYERMLCHQATTSTRFHKGLPLFHMSRCYQSLGRIVHAKRYMMLVLCEDAVTGKGTLNLRDTGSYGLLAWFYGLSDQQIRRYAEQAHAEYITHPAEAAMPEWIVQQLDQHWKTEIPLAQEAGVYRITRRYCEFLMARLGSGNGRDLERLAEYLVGAMPGCRTHRRARTYSTDHDVIVSVEGSIVDYRSELGRYFACECKDKAEDRASFPEIAKFCRVLDSVKAKFGIVFCPTGHSGAGKAVDADREILKVYQDRGVVIVVVDRDDLQCVADGANFISMLREKYEVVRLDLRMPKVKEVLP
jgi:hypothetical protein